MLPPKSNYKVNPNQTTFNGAETNCGIAHILGILLKNSYEFQILLEATFIYSLFPSNCNQREQNILVFCFIPIPDLASPGVKNSYPC